MIPARLALNIEPRIGCILHGSRKREDDLGNVAEVALNLIRGRKVLDHDARRAPIHFIHELRIFVRFKFVDVEKG